MPRKTSGAAVPGELLHPLERLPDLPGPPSPPPASIPASIVSVTPESPESKEGPASIPASGSPPSAKAQTPLSVLQLKFGLNTPQVSNEPPPKFTT